LSLILKIAKELEKIWKLNIYIQWLG